MAKQGFWDNPEAAQKVVRELKALKAIVEPWGDFESACSDAEVLLEMSLEADEASAIADLEREAEGLAARLDRLEFQAAMADPHDALDCFVSIHAGAGGTDAADWADTLLRMYLRYCERRGFATELVDRLPAEEAGIRKATFKVKGPWASGYFRAEMGVHRLVRLSPFDAAHRRQTSFASLDMMPEVEEAEVEVNEADLKIDTYRSGGAGGQHVNVTDSAVRVTHLPTGIVIACQNERSQHKNRRMAMLLLKAKLCQMQDEARQDELKKMYGEKGEIAWGYQIRSYVLHPYKLVKDLRTGVETSNVDAVLDGEIDEFIEAWLKSRIGGGRKKS
jgi:peptide chain release factor 2